MDDVSEERLSARVTQIRDDLTELFLAEGFRGLDLDAMAAHARCSKSTLYALAQSKDQLVAGCVEHFFRRAARRVEAAVDAETDRDRRVHAYLLAVATELDAASERFLDDVAAQPATRATYERHTAIAASRIRELIADSVGGVEDGGGTAAVRFLAEVTAAAMDAIERGGISARTGLTHAQAYAALADLVVRSIRP